jgi:two-component system response regulator
MSLSVSILLAEDSPNDVELIESALSTAIDIRNLVVVNDGVEALDYLLYRGKYKKRTVENPVLILLDIKMPRMDGIEVLQQIRNVESLKVVPVVMLSSSREETDLKECYALGVNAYVVKPVAFDDFFRAIKMLGVFWVSKNRLS